MPKNILVTGAAGFIGSHLCEELVQRGHRVSGIDDFDAFYDRSVKERNLANLLPNPLFDFIAGDAGDPSVLDQLKQSPDVVIHLAARAGVQPSLQDPAAYIQGNILLTNQLLEWMRRNGIRKMLFASSSSVYGNAAITPFSEDQQLDQPVSPYAFTKRSCELMNYTYHYLYGFDILNLRFFTVYGERQRPDLAIHRFMNKIWQGEPIRLYGDGQTSRDYTYWKDTVNGISAALDYIAGRENVFEAINLGNHRPVKLHELIEQIAAAMGMQPKLIYEDKKPGDVDITYADISKAKKLLGYDPQTSLAEGLRHFFAWFKELNGPASIKTGQV